METGDLGFFVTLWILRRPGIQVVLVMIHYRLVVSVSIATCIVDSQSNVMDYRNY